MVKLSEAEVIAGFDVYLECCLQRAQREKVLDADPSTLDMAFSGQALALFYAAITACHPPSIPIPPSSELNPYTSPPSFAQFTTRWVILVPSITSLPSHDKFDLARILCDREPLLSSQRTSSPTDLTTIATQLRFLAIQLEQLREFRKSFSSGHTFAVAPKRNAVSLLSRPGFSSRRHAPPPPIKILPLSYGVPWQNYSVPSSPIEGGPPQQHLSLGVISSNPAAIARPKPPAVITLFQPSQKPPLRRKKSTPLSPKSDISTLKFPPSEPERPSSSQGVTSRPVSGTNKRLLGPRKHHHSRAASSSLVSDIIASSQSSNPKPIIPLPILTIRETLYGAIAEVLYIYPSLPILYARDPPRAFFTTVSLAILSISLSSLSSDGMSIRSVLGTDLVVSDMPADYPSPDEGGDYRSFIEELMGIGRRGRTMVEEDDARAVACAVRGKDLPSPRIDRLRWILEHGVGYVDEKGERRGEDSLAGLTYGTTVVLALRINRLAMRVVKMKSLFKTECGEELLSILAGLST